MNHIASPKGKFRYKINPNLEIYLSFYSSIYGIKQIFGLVVDAYTNTYIYINIG